MNAIDSDSASDVSSDSSWTVLNEGNSLENLKSIEDDVKLLSPDSSQDCILIEDESHETIMPRPIILTADDSRHSQDISGKETLKDGFLTLEEYVAERAIEHDYEFDDKAPLFEEIVNDKQSRKKFKKCKAKTFGALTIMGAILSVAGISLLCLLTPHTAISSNRLAENIKTNFTKISESCDGSKYEVYLGESEEALKLADNMDIFHQCVDQNEKLFDNPKGKVEVDAKEAKTDKRKVLSKIPARGSLSKYGPPTYEEFIMSNHELKKEIKEKEFKDLGNSNSNGVTDESQINSKLSKTIKDKINNQATKIPNKLSCVEGESTIKLSDDQAEVKSEPKCLNIDIPNSNLKPFKTDALNYETPTTKSSETTSVECPAGSNPENNPTTFKLPQDIKPKHSTNINDFKPPAKNQQKDESDNFSLANKAASAKKSMESRFRFKRRLLPRRERELRAIKKRLSTPIQLSQDPVKPVDSKQSVFVLPTFEKIASTFTEAIDKITTTSKSEKSGDAISESNNVLNENKITNEKSVSNRNTISRDNRVSNGTPNKASTTNKASTIAKAVENKSTNNKASVLNKPLTRPSGGLKAPHKPTQPNLKPTNSAKNDNSYEKTSNLKAKCPNIPENESLNETLKVLEKKSNQSILLNMLQDLILLRLTSKVASKVRQRAEEAEERKKKLKKMLNTTIVSISSECSKGPTLSEVFSPVINLDCPQISTENSKEKLFKELPFGPSSTSVTACSKIYNPSFRLKPVKISPSVIRNLPEPEEKQVESKGTFLLDNKSKLPRLKLKAKRRLPETDDVVDKKYTIELPNPSLVERKESSLQLEELQRRCRDERRRLFLEEIQKHREKREEILRNMQIEKNKMLANMMRESKKLKDVASGMYNVPLPNASDVTLKLQELKSKEDSAANSLAEQFIESFRNERDGVRHRLRSTTSSLQTIGEKTDSKSEWKLKKASTLTCIKNSCTKVHADVLIEKLKRLDALEAGQSQEKVLEDERKQERHEQLKKYWKTRQKYMEKRLEICDLLQRKIVDQVDRKCHSDQFETNGVQVLDRIITDVLSSASLKKTSSCFVSKNGERCSTTVECCCTRKPSENNCLSKSTVNMKNIPFNELDTKKKCFYEYFFGKRGPEIYEKDRKRWFDKETPVSLSLSGFVKAAPGKLDPKRSYKGKLLMNKKNL